MAFRSSGYIHCPGQPALGQHATHGARREKEHGFGFQAAIGGDLGRLDDEFYFFGLIYEVVPGAGISGGLALTQVESLQPGHVAGTLVDPSEIRRLRTRGLDSISGSA
jgi:hypothetical protein